MTSPLSRSALRLCIALCLALLPLPAFAAGYTVNIPNGLYNNGAAYGNSADGGVTSDFARPDGNTLNINSGGTVSSVAYGASVSGNGVRSASGNTLSVGNGGTVQSSVTGAYVYSMTNDATASGNSVRVEAGGTAGYAFGGSANTSGVGSAGVAEANAVTIGGTVTGTVTGGTTQSIASGSATASRNVVTINAGAVIGGTIIGGEAITSAATASHNSVTINGGTVNGDVIGGRARSMFSTNLNAINNTVTVKGGAFGAASRLRGGDFDGRTGTDAFSGNTLNLHAAGLTVAGVENFEYLNFHLPSTLAANAVVLAVTGTADLTDGAGRSSTVNVGIEGGSSPLKKGDRVILIDAGTLTADSGLNTTADGRGMQGVTLIYDFTLLVEGNRLVGVVANGGTNPQLKSLSEGRAAGHAFLNQGSDLIIGPGMHSLLASAQGAAPGGVVPFAAAGGGWSRYNTGSHVDVSGASILAGLGWRQPFNEGRAGSLLAGAFFEAGWGGYDSHNSFSNAASVKGDGDISYYGGGLLGRYDFAPAGPGNIYLDASFRAGHVSTDFDSSDLRDSAGRKANYDSGSAYYGAHAGLGYVWAISEKASLDLSTRYIWTHQDSDSVKVLGDPVRFKAADSHRWRSGARFAYAVNEYIAPYVGAYYDHEFDGKARASTNGHGVDAPDLKGGTGAGELGLTVKPVKDNGFSFDLAVQGYTGVREGVTGSLQLKFEF